MHQQVKKKVSINIARFWNGATAEEIIKYILPDLEPYFEFEISNSPRVLLYGPYNGPHVAQLPEGHSVKVFIGCENVRPIMHECDWAFGVLNEHLVKHPRYMRIMRWGDHWDLTQKKRNWSDVLRSKTRFCAFIYAHRVYYREAFFRVLSRYKKIDSPGRSMNNMPSIDPVPGSPDWSVKVEFLRNYKFVIAFENGSRAGYHTEKLSHAIEADCVPIYWGDPEISDAFNTRRFVNAHDYLPKPLSFLPRLPDSPHSLRSSGRRTPLVKTIRRINGAASEIEQRVWSLAGFRPLIDRVTQLDCDDELYLEHLREPFLINNNLPDRSRWIARWKEIFNSALTMI